MVYGFWFVVDSLRSIVYDLWLRFFGQGFKEGTQSVPAWDWQRHPGILPRHYTDVLLIILHSHVNLACCDRIKPSNTLLPRKSGFSRARNSCRI